MTTNTTDCASDSASEINDAGGEKGQCKASGSEEVDFESQLDFRNVLATTHRGRIMHRDDLCSTFDYTIGAVSHRNNMIMQLCKAKKNTSLIFHIFHHHERRSNPIQVGRQFSGAIVFLSCISSVAVSRHVGGGTQRGKNKSKDIFSIYQRVRCRDRRVRYAPSHCFSAS